MLFLVQRPQQNDITPVQASVFKEISRPWQVQQFLQSELSQLSFPLDPRLGLTKCTGCWASVR